MPVIAAEKIERWVQPEPTTTRGDTTVEFTGLSETVVSGFARVTLLTLSLVPLIPAVDGDAQVVPYGSALGSVSQVGVAEVVFDGTGDTLLNTEVRDAIALVQITAVGEISVETSGPAFSAVYPEGRPVIPLEGDAEVSFYDYGAGSNPVFPFRLPITFLDGFFGARDGAAIVTIVDDPGSDTAAGVDATAQVGIITPGLFSLLGNAAVFPLLFPVVFDDAAVNVRIGVAEVAVTARCDVVVSVGGDAEVAVSAPGLRFNIAVFPFDFPIVFSGEHDGVAVVEISAEGDFSPVLEGVGAVDVYSVGEVEGES